MDENAGRFVAEIDSAVQAHLDWTRRLLRCGILREPPSQDVFDQNAHQLCRFGKWLITRREVFCALDHARTEELELAHRAMHDATRHLCFQILSGESADATDLETFESKQSQLMDSLAYFKTLAVSRSSHIDTLTGLRTRHGIEQDFELLRQHASRLETELLVAMIDVDHFKRVNDVHGHDAGDTALCAVASVLRDGVRRQDQIYRYGGEEFLLLMNLNKVEQAATLAEKILGLVRELSVTLDGGASIRLSVSIGVAVWRPNEDLQSVIRRADRALYEGKAGGRDRFVIASPEHQRDQSGGPPCGYVTRNTH